jgi:hypothetical protein
VNVRAALSICALMLGACTLDHPLGQTGAGGAAGGFCGGNGVGGGAGGGGSSGVTPIDECNPMAPGSCSDQGQHCVLTLDSMCPDLCRGWCLPLQTVHPTMCGTGLAACPAGMACLEDPIASCDPFMECGCQGVCYGVDITVSGGTTGSCVLDAGQGGCLASEHCVADPVCGADGGCAGVCVASSQPQAIACGPWPDFGCPTSTHCLKNPNHDCALPLACPGVCSPD